MHHVVYVADPEVKIFQIFKVISISLNRTIVYLSIFTYRPIDAFFLFSIKEILNKIKFD